MRFQAAVLRGVVLLLAAWAATACAAPAPAASGRVPTPAGPVDAAPTLAAALPSAWRTYTDPSLGYSLSFPEDVDFTLGTSRAGIYTARLQFRVPGVDGYQGMVLRVEPNPERRGIEQIVGELYRRNLLAEPQVGWVDQLAGVTVAGLSGVQMGREGDVSLVVPYQDRVYIVAPVHDVTTTALDPQALALFYQVLATLRLPQ